MRWLVLKAQDNRHIKPEEPFIPSPEGRGLLAFLDNFAAKLTNVIRLLHINPEMT
jgi:hypothetical protein